MINKSKVFCSLFLLIFILIHQQEVLAHEIRPAYLEIKEDSTGIFTIKWKVPLLENRIPNIYPVFSISDNLIKNNESRSFSSFTTFFTLNTVSNIGGTQLSIYNLDKTLIDVIVRIERQSGEIHTMLLQPSSSSEMIPASSSSWQVVKTFGILGVEHILLGWDHLLFVLGLLLLIKNKSTLITTITAFTFAHSITLILSSLDHLTLPSAPVETVIALSVIFLGREYVMVQRGYTSMTAEKPWLVALTFGLLHGFGFAGALSNIGLPNHAIFTSLLSFNVGVEIGQILFVVALILLYKLFSNFTDVKKHDVVLIMPGYLIGGVASFWFIGRLLDIVV